MFFYRALQAYMAAHPSYLNPECVELCSPSMLSSTEAAHDHRRRLMPKVSTTPQNSTTFRTSRVKFKNLGNQHHPLTIFRQINLKALHRRRLTKKRLRSSESLGCGQKTSYPLSNSPWDSFIFGLFPSLNFYSGMMSTLQP